MSEILAKLRLQAIERSLLEGLEIMLGRVPTNQEIARNGRKVIHADGREVWCYNGIPIIQVGNMVLEGNTLKIEITKFIKETEPNEPK